MLIFLLLPALSSFIKRTSPASNTCPFFFLINVFKLFICMIRTVGICFICITVHYYHYLFYFTNCPRFAMAFLDDSTHRSVLCLKINPLQEMPVWRCGIGGKWKCIGWRRKMPVVLKDKGYWNPDPGCSKNERQRPWIQKLRVAITPDFYTVAGDLTIWQLARRFKKNIYMSVSSEHTEVSQKP